MIRRCTGEDPNLIMYVDKQTGDRIERKLTSDATMKPCDCGKVFNDELHSVIYPHERI